MTSAPSSAIGSNRSLAPQMASRLSASCASAAASATPGFLVVDSLTGSVGDDEHLWGRA